MNRRGARLDVPDWRTVNKRRADLMDELKEVAPQGTAGKLGKQLDHTVSVISSTKPAEEAGAELNTVLEIFIDMLRIAIENSSASSSGGGGEVNTNEAALAGEELERRTEEFNRQLAEMRTEFQNVEQHQEELLATLERVRRERNEALIERDNAVNAHARCRPGNNNINVSAAEARAEKLLQENQKLQEELDELYQALDDVEQAEQDERRRRKRRDAKK